MDVWIYGVAALGLLLIAVFMLMRWLGRKRWNVTDRALLATLESARSAPSETRYHATELKGLPPPVARYFRKVLKDGQAMVSAVDISQTGIFNMRPERTKWVPFVATQRVITRAPGFVWNACIKLFGVIDVYVHDGYSRGKGTLQPSVMGWFSLGDMANAESLAQGELVRYVAEAPWYPTALLPSQGVHWQAIDDRRARFTFYDGDISITCLVIFNADHLIETLRVENRAAISGKVTVMMPWEARLSGYQYRHGMLLPLKGEAAWIKQGQRRPYWRGTITRINFEFAAD
jgi:hypothetical protein